MTYPGRGEARFEAETQLGVPMLRLEKITKAFPGVLANDQVDLEVAAGEIHALLGENGAGKTTLMEIVSGLYQPDEGRIIVQGRDVRISSPRDAINDGIGMVHQNFMLIPTLTVAENILLGLPSRGPWLDLSSLEGEIERLCRNYGLNINPRMPVADLAVGLRQWVEIIKVLYRGAHLVILDEPTSSLGPREVDELFQALRKLVEEGHSVVFISHKLEEVMRISDRITVLRRGRVVATVRRDEASQLELARMMVGRDVALRLDKPKAQLGEKVLELAGVQVAGRDGRNVLKDITLAVHAGEILGIAGVDGNGQKELAEVISGLGMATGDVRILGQDVGRLSARQIMGMRVGHIPGDRETAGLVRGASISENLIVKHFYCHPFSQCGLLRWGEIYGHAQRLMQEYDIRGLGPRAMVDHLSGGNQQKVLLARELCQEPILLLAVQPTRGLDVGATEYVHRALLGCRERGAAIVLVSTDLDEVLTLSDKIAVLFQGEIMGILSSKEVDLHQLGLMMAGIRSQAGVA